MNFDVTALLSTVIERKASDIHIIVGMPPTLRIQGVLTPLPEYGEVRAEQASTFVQTILSPVQREEYGHNKELDFSFGFFVTPFANMIVDNVTINVD